MEKTIRTFNDLPEVIAQLRDEVMSLKSLLTEQRSVNNAKTTFCQCSSLIKYNVLRLGKQF